MTLSLSRFALPLGTALIAASSAFAPLAHAADAKMKPHAEDAMKPDAMAPDGAMKADTMKPDAMTSDAMKADAMAPDTMKPKAK